MNRQPSRLSLSTLLVLAMTAAVPLAVATGFSNFERPRHLVLAVLAALALVSWGVGLVRHGRARMSSPGTMALGAAFGVVVVGSLAWSGLPLFGAVSVITWGSLGVVFLVLAAPVGRAPQFLDWATAVATGTIGAGGLGLYELFGGDALTPVWDPAGMAGGFDSIAFAAAYYALAIPLLVGAVGISCGLRRWFLALGLLLGMLHFGLVVDPLTLVVVTAVMGALGLVMYLMHGGEVQSPGRMAAVSAVLAVAVAVAGLWLFDRPEEPTAAVDLPRIAEAGQFDDEKAEDPRKSWWYFAADRTESPVDQRFRPYLNSVARGLWQQEPLIGHGAGGWWLMQSDVIDDSDPVVQSMFDRYPAFKSPHSDYARVLVEQGALGLFLFLLWIAGLVTAMVGGMRGGALADANTRVTFWALGSTVVIGLILMVFMPVVELISSGILWFGAAALAVAHAARHTDANRWLIRHDAASEHSWRRIGIAFLAVVVAVAAVVPAAQHGQAALERGHADHMMLRTHFHDAVPLYEKAHELYPAYPGVLYNIATAQTFLSSSSEGEESMEEALDMRPYDARFLTRAANIALRIHHIDTALAYGQEAVRTGPNYLPAYDVYAMALQLRGRYMDSARLLEAMLDRHPPRQKRGAIRTRYAALLSEHAEEHERALEHYELAMEELPHGPERTLLVDRIEILEKEIKRRELEEAGEPIPPELHPGFDDHGHDHGHDHGIRPPVQPEDYLRDHDHDHRHDHDHHHDHDHDHHHH